MNALWNRNDEQEVYEGFPLGYVDFGHFAIHQSDLLRFTEDIARFCRCLPIAMELYYLEFEKQEDTPRYGELKASISKEDLEATDREWIAVAEAEHAESDRLPSLLYAVYKSCST